MNVVVHLVLTAKFPIQPNFVSLLIAEIATYITAKCSNC